MDSGRSFGPDDAQDLIPFARPNRLPPTYLHALIRGRKPITLLLDEHHVIDGKRQLCLLATVPFWNWWNINQSIQLFQERHYHVGQHPAIGVHRWFVWRNLLNFLGIVGVQDQGVQMFEEKSQEDFQGQDEILAAERNLLLHTVASVLLRCAPMARQSISVKDRYKLSCINRSFHRVCCMACVFVIQKLTLQ